jgi:hypothetical protein
MTTTVEAAQHLSTRPIDAVGQDRAEPAPGQELLDVWIMLPTQLVGGTRTADLSGEKRLMAAVLADAIRLYAKHRPSPTAGGQILFRETERWIESYSRGWLLSFENVCEVLDIDPERLRGVLRATAFGDRRLLSVDVGRSRVSRGRKIRV